MNIDVKCYRCGWEFCVETDEEIPAEYLPKVCAACAGAMNPVVHEPYPPAHLAELDARRADGTEIKDGHVYRMDGRFYVFNELPFGLPGDGWMQLIDKYGNDVRRDGEITLYSYRAAAGNWVAQVRVRDDIAAQTVDVYADTRDFVHVASSREEFAQPAASWDAFVGDGSGTDDAHINAVVCELLADVNI